MLLVVLILFLLTRSDGGATASDTSTADDATIFAAADFNCPNTNP